MFFFLFYKGKSLGNFRGFLAFFLCLANVLLFSPLVNAQNISLDSIPKPGEFIFLSRSFNPPILKGIQFYPNDPLRFDFIVDKGDADLSEEELRQQISKLIRYFLASLTLPENEVWVNLSPYEEDDIAPQILTLTEMGKDLLAEDYKLKQLFSSLTYPDTPLGKKFWENVYEKAYQLYGTTKIPVNTFNKVWIVPDKATVYESRDRVVLGDTHLKVMMEEDYLAFNKHRVLPKAKLASFHKKDAEKLNNLSSEVAKKIILPSVEKDVNYGKNFALLRQIYSSFVLAKWFKQKLKESILNKVYSDKKKIKGVEVKNPQIKEVIYEQYMQAYRRGVYNYIRKDFDESQKKYIKRKYYSGGITFVSSPLNTEFTPLLPANNIPVTSIVKETVIEEIRAVPQQSIQEAFSATPQFKKEILLLSFRNLPAEKIVPVFQKFIPPEEAQELAKNITQIVSQTPEVSYADIEELINKSTNNPEITNEIFQDIVTLPEVKEEVLPIALANLSAQDSQKVLGSLNLRNPEEAYSGIEELKGVLNNLMSVTVEVAPTSVSFSIIPSEIANFINTPNLIEEASTGIPQLANALLVDKLALQVESLPVAQLVEASIALQKLSRMSLEVQLEKSLPKGDIDNVVNLVDSDKVKEAVLLMSQKAPSLIDDLSSLARNKYRSEVNRALANIALQSLDKEKIKSIFEETGVSSKESIELADRIENIKDKLAQPNIATPGGIDLSPRNFKVEVKGEGLRITYLNTTFDIKNIEGFTFKILKIRRLTDL